MQAAVGLLTDVAVFDLTCVDSYTPRQTASRTGLRTKQNRQWAA
jgi:hypothetical protein